MRRYRAAVLGCGPRGRAAALAYAAHGRTDLVALCDLQSERLNSLGDELRVAARYTDLDRMIEAERPDIVAIATATNFHYDLCLRVLEHGVHVEVEKPMTVDLVEADALVAKAKEKNVRLAVHHQSRVGGSVQAAARAVRQGRIGRLRFISAADKGYYGGYGLMNIGCHIINNLLELAGPCRSVSAFATAGGELIEPDDAVLAPSGMGPIAGEHITAHLRFDDNVTATVAFHPPHGPYRIELFGSQGRVLWVKSKGAYLTSEVDLNPEGEEWTRLEDVIRTDVRSGAATAPEGVDPDDVAFVDEYVRALDEGREHVCSGEQGRHVMEVIMGVFESAAYGTVVQLPQVRRDHPLLRWRQEAGLSPPDPVPFEYGDWLRHETARLEKKRTAS